MMASTPVSAGRELDAHCKLAHDLAASGRADAAVMPSLVFHRPFAPEGIMKKGEREVEQNRPSMHECVASM